MAENVLREPEEAPQPPAGPPRPGLVRSLGALSAGTVAAQSLSFAQGIVYRGLLGPAQAGVYNFAQIVQGYLERSSVGVGLSAERLIPVARGAGDTDRASLLRDHMFTFALLEGAIVGFAMAFALLLTGGIAADLLHAALAAAAVANFLLRLSGAYVVSLRTLHQFSIVGQAQVAGAAAAFVGVVVGTTAFGFFGLLLGAPLAFGAQVLVCEAARRRHKLFSWRLRLTWREAAPLVSTGLLLSAATWITSFFMSLDSLLVASATGAASLAVYTLAVTMVRYASEVPTHVASILTPQAQEELGRGMPKVVVTERIGRFLVANLAVVVPVVALLLLVGTHLLVHAFLSAFVGSLPVLDVLVFGLLFAPQANLVANVLISAGHTRLFLIANLIAVGAVAGSVLACFALFGPQLETAAGGAVAGQFVFFLALVGAYRRVAGPGSARSFVRPFVASFLILAGEVATVRLAWSGDPQTLPGWLLASVVAMAAGILLVLPLAWWGNREAELGLVERARRILAAGSVHGAGGG